MNLGGLGLPNLQGVYDATNAVPHIVLAAGQPLTIRDNATPIGDVFVLEDNAGVDFLNVNPGQLNFGPAGDRTIEINDNPAGQGGIRYVPDGRTFTSFTPTQAAVQWDSLVISAIPGGAPFGNDTAPAMIFSIGECRFDDNAFLFATSLLFNQGTTISANVGNLGPIYTMVHQPTIRSVSAGAKTCSQMNAVRAQPRIGPNTAGSMTQTSADLFFATLLIDGSVGAAVVTDSAYFRALAPTLTGGGLVGTLSCFRIENIPAAGITNLYGIDSAMNSGYFIAHGGIAPSYFNGLVQMFNTRALQFGTTNGVQFSRTGVGIITQAGWGSTNNENLLWDHETVANNVTITSGTGAGLRINTAAVSIGATSADPSANWQLGLTPGAKTITVAGDFARTLFSAAANVTVNAAMANLATFLINSPGITIGSGSVVNAANVLIQTAPGAGTNRYGLLVTSNPTGGTLNYCARFQGAAGVRIDGLLGHYGTLLGFFGTAPAVQAAAYTPTNVTPDRSYDANSTTLDEIADVLGTLIADLQTYGLLQ